MNKIARKCGGNFYYVQDINTVSETFVDCLGNLSSIIGRNCTVEVKLLPSALLPNMKFKKTYGNSFSVPKDSSKSDTVRVLNLNNIIKGYNKDFMFEIEISGVSNSDMLSFDSDVANIKKHLVDLIEANLTINNINKDQFFMRKTYSLPVINENLPSSFTTVNVNEEVIKNLLRVKGVETMHEAMTFADNKKYEEGENL